MIKILTAGDWAFGRLVFLLTSAILYERNQKDDERRKINQLGEAYFHKQRRLRAA